MPLRLNASARLCASGWGLNDRPLGRGAGVRRRVTLGYVTDSSHVRSSRSADQDEQNQQSLEQSANAQIDYTCPRCGEGVTESFYGPCAACRNALRSGAAQPAGTESARETVSADDHGRAPGDTWIDNL